MALDGRNWGTELGDAWTACALHITPADPAQTVASPVETMQVNAIEAQYDLNEKMCGIDAYLNDPGNTSIFGELCGQIGNALGELNQECNQLLPQQPVATASLDDRPGMDIDLDKLKSTMIVNSEKAPPPVQDFTPHTPGFSLSA